MKWSKSGDVREKGRQNNNNNNNSNKSHLKDIAKEGRVQEGQHQPVPTDFLSKSSL